ncbi:neural cell adhesion molecule 1 [Augochlora pura]
MWWRCQWSVATTTTVFVLGIATVYSQLEISDLDKPIPIINVSGVQGGKTDLPCDIRTADNDGVSIVLWYKGGNEKPIYGYDGRGGRQFGNTRLWSSPSALGKRAFFVTETNPAHLTIDRLQLSDEGIYWCRVDFKNSPTRKQKMNLTVIVPPSTPVIRDPTTRNISRIEELYNEGSDVNLICEVQGGRPPPKLTWYLENNVIDESYDNLQSGLTVNRLSYPKVGRQHLNDRLICKASNTNLIMPQTRLVILNMNLKPLVVQILTKESRVSADKNYDVECWTNGSRPNAEITWWKANKQIKTMVKNYAENNLSILSFVPSIEDNGKYLTCRAENPALPDSALEDKWKLDVQYQPLVTLKMGETLNPDDIKEGDDVYFDCSVRANPKAYKLAWFKDGKELKNNATAGIVLSDYSLVLQGITRYSAGDYTCLAANSEGKTDSNPVALRIMYTPVCKEGRGEVVVGALKQETVSLVCSVESHPPPLTFHWTFNNSGELVEVPHSRYSHVPAPGTPSVAESLKEYQQFHGSKLNYTPATEMDYGTVACWASNQVGKQRAPCLFQVIAAGRPYALHNCTVTEMSAPLDADELGAKSGTGLLVRCLEGYDGGLPIFSYQLEVVADEDGGPILLNKTVPASPNGPTFEVAGLTTGRSYRLFLYAINAKGRSEPAILEPVTLKGVAMYTTERRPLTYTPIYKTPPQRRKKDRATDESISPEKRPIVQHGLDLPSDPILSDCLPTPTINYPQNHIPQSNTYNHTPTMADFKQIAMDAYNQRNNQNVYYSLQRSSKGLSSMPQRPVSSSISAQGKFHQPEVVTRSNRIQESCI